MRKISVSLDGIAVLRETTGAREADPAAAALLAELGGADAVRLGLSEEMRPVRESDVHAVRRAASVLGSRLAPVPSLIKVALEVQPQRVVLASEARDSSTGPAPLDFRAWGTALPPAVRTLREAGIAVSALISADLPDVKAAHAANVDGIELCSAAVLELPEGERRDGLERLGDAGRLAAKLRLDVGVAGGIGFRTVGPVLSAVASAQRLSVGRAFITRALLVGIDRAIRDLTARVATD